MIHPLCTTESTTPQYILLPIPILIDQKRFSARHLLPGIEYQQPNLNRSVMPFCYEISSLEIMVKISLKEINKVCLLIKYKKEVEKGFSRYPHR